MARRLLLYAFAVSALLLPAQVACGDWAEVQSTPSESECRPYIEKALKQLGTSDSPEEGDIPNVVEDQIVSIEDELSEQDTEQRIQNDEPQLSAEETETLVEDKLTDESEETPTQVTEEEPSPSEEEPALEAESLTVEEEALSVEDAKEQSEDETSQEASTEQAEEVTAETEQEGSAEVKSGEAEESVVEVPESIQSTGSEEEATDSGDKEGDEASTDAEVKIEESVDKQDEDSQQLESTEQDTVTTSVEGDEEREEEKKTSEEETSTVSQEVDETGESKEEKLTEEAEADSVESKEDVAEEAQPETETVSESVETTADQTEESVEQSEDDKESAAEEKASKEDVEEQEEKSKEEPVEQDDSGRSEEQAVEGESKEEQTAEGESKEEQAAEGEGDEAAESEQTPESEEQSEDIKTAEASSEDKAESQETTEPGETEEGVSDQPEETVSEVSQEEVTGESTETDEKPELSLGESKEEVTEVSEEEEPKEDKTSEEAKSSEEPSPEEEDLIIGAEIPEKLRPREHITEILRLDSESAETELLLSKTIDATLRELKKLYEAAIKPLELLYKYRDLSNRHFGDPEIFSKPLILFMGPWSGGKSTIINYLLDNEYKMSALRTGAEPSPAYFNIVMWGERSEVLDGTQLAADWTFSGLQKFGQGLLDRLRGHKLNHPLLEKVNIVEIPGILEIRKQVERLFPFNDACQWFIDRADIIFLVYDPSKLDVGPESEAILDQLKGREYQTRIILNKADQVKPEELMRVQGTLIWNISPLMSSTEPPVMYSTSLWSLPYESGAPTRLLYAQEKAFLRDLREAIDKRVENKIASARRFAVRVRNHAKMVDCYLTTFYNHKTFFGNRQKISDDIIEHPQNYHIYEGLSTLTNISRYDLPDPDVYKDFFKLNPVYNFQQLSSTCTYFRGCPINRLDVAIAYELPELVGKYKKSAEEMLASRNIEKS